MNCPKTLRNGIERCIPINGMIADFGRHEPLIRTQRLTQRHPFGAKPAMVGGMIRVAPDGNPTLFIHAGDDTATNAAVSAGGAHVLSGFWQPEHGSGSLGNSRIGLCAGDIQLNEPCI